MLAKIRDLPKWIFILLGIVCFILMGGWFYIAFSIVYIVTMSNIFMEHAPLALKLSVAICFIVPFILRVLLPESAKKMLYYLAPVAFMMAQSYIDELNMANVVDSAFINSYMQPLFCNVLPVVVGLMLGWFVKNIIDEMKKK